MGNYIQAQQKMAVQGLAYSGLGISTQTLAADLAFQKQQAEEKVNRLARAIELLEKNPEVAELFDLLKNNY